MGTGRHLPSALGLSKASPPHPCAFGHVRRDSLPVPTWGRPVWARVGVMHVCPSSPRRHRCWRWTCDVTGLIGSLLSVDVRRPSGEVVFHWGQSPLWDEPGALWRRCRDPQAQVTDGWRVHSTGPSEPATRLFALTVSPLLLPEGSQLPFLTLDWPSQCVSSIGGIASSQGTRPCSTPLPGDPGHL